MASPPRFKDEIKPRRGHEGSDIIGPRNPNREHQEPDLISPPSTDAGKFANMKWSFADSHMRLEEGGWARETTVRELPTSTELAAVNMRLKEGVYRIGKGATEFLLIFDDGNFSEDSTFLLTEWLAHSDKNVLAKNFNVPREIFNNLSQKGGHF
ncbi:hypothetical protein V501_01463 [Pseudogymnoascus sp. VKM F-4519 (FW-2642)]|nr:hypothetical protein V501_01463 [Pseudogymnoascus sp. VKM F-4519 (FW-2642)]